MVGWAKAEEVYRRGKQAGRSGGNKHPSTCHGILQAREVTNRIAYSPGNAIRKGREGEKSGSEMSEHPLTNRSVASVDRVRNERIPIDQLNTSEKHVRRWRVVATHRRTR